MKFALTIFFPLLLAASASAQTLLYQWNFDNAAGSGAALTVAPSFVDGSMTGGTLTNISGVATISAPVGSGVYGTVMSSDLGCVNSGVFRSTVGDLGTIAGDLSLISSFTVGLWVNFNATVTNYTAGGNTLFAAGNTLLSRLFDVSTNGVDGSELYFAFNGANLQFGVNKNGTGNTTTSSPLTPLGLTSSTITNTWIFIAATYTNTAGGTVNLYTGTTTTNATLVSTLTAVGAISWSSNTNLITIGNTGNTGANRSLPGSMDNVSFYSGVLTLAQIVNLQTNLALATNRPTVGTAVVSPAGTIYLGSSITITSAFGGTAPLFFQWQTDGGSGTLTNFPGATNVTLVATPFKTGTFQYNLIVTNNYGSATSAVASVTVVPAPGTANVTVNVASNLSTVASTAYGLHTSTYDNQNGNASTPTQLIQSGVNTLRYPGGGYADVFHWSVTRPGLGGANGYGYSPWQGGSYAYMGSQTDFGNFVKLLTNAQCQAVITVNWGSGLQWSAGHTNLIAPSTNAEPPEAAAWVAYANSATNIFGAVNDITIGVDSLGNDWKTAGYWAMLRAASPLGVDDGYNFLRIGRKLPLGIKYWEIGNETFGTGYYSAGSDGYSVNYAVPYPNSTYPRYGNTNLSPAVYGKGVKSFSQLMKSVDPTIKIGAVVTTPETWDTYDNGPHWMAEVLAQCATNIDFVINHSYPYAGSLADGTSLLSGNGAYIQDMINGNGNHTGLNAGLHDLINTYRSDGTNVQIFITEFAYVGSVTNSLNGEPIYGPVNGLLAADSYATWMDLGVSNIDWLEMNKNTFLGDSNPLLRGATYYAVQLTHAMAGVGDALVATTDDSSTLRVHAAVRQDGKIGVMLLNENLTSNLTVNVTILNANLASSATMYQFGTNNFASGNPITPATGPTTNTVSVSGNTFSVVVPPYTMAVLTVATNATTAANTAPVLAAIGNQTVNVGQTVAFTASATETDAPPQTLTFTLLAGATNAALNPSSGAFSWRPLVTQANSTNAFSLKVADSGTPSLSATQNFSVTVNPVTLPQFTNISTLNGKFNLQVNGQAGPDYEVQSSTNLTQWSVAFITNSPTMPFNWTDVNTTNIPVRFYRVIVGPPLP